MIVDKNFSLTASPKGIILLFGAVASALVYGILLKKLTLKYSPVAIIAVQNLIGVLYMFPVVLFLEGSKVLSFQFESKLIISLLLLGILASSAAFVFFTKAVKHLGISKANIYTNLIPVFTAFFSFLVLGELISVEKFLAIALVITGVILSQQKKQKTLPLAHKYQ
ncbi:MAG: DMT family transporter [Ignavibacteria bacterium]|nr:DMT family transporter [Ignavibacteria bacterium]